MADELLVAPFPWFGGKRKVAPIVWKAFGDVGNYVEPFFGSGAVLLGREQPFGGVETINDKDGYVSNFWRAVQHAPGEVAEAATWPQNENDLHARHAWLLQKKETLVKQLEGDPEFYDSKVAGWWVWGLCLWIGSGFCSGKGPWHVDENRQLIHLGSAGQGISRQLIHLGSAGQGINRKLIHLGDAGQGINRKRIHLGDGENVLFPIFEALAKRLQRVRICSGDWERVTGPSVTFKHGITGVFLDPPYADTALRTTNLYNVDSDSVAHAVRKWAIDNGENNKMRIALCGYEGEHVLPNNWFTYEWKAPGGYEGQGEERTENCKKERIWFSPHCLCLKSSPKNMFDMGEDDGQ